MATVYTPKAVQKILDYYGPSLFHYEEGMTVRERLTTLAHHLCKAVENNNDAVCNEINNYHPDFIGKRWIEIRNNGFTEEEAFKTMARQYGFAEFEDIPDNSLHIEFERAVDMILDGAVNRLSDLLSDHPDLPHLQSKYGHGATLLHYTGSNGVELYRQVVPANLPVLIELLVHHGADLNAKMNVYGGQYTTRELFNTSAHPHDAGVYERAKSVFEDLSSKEE